MATAETASLRRGLRALSAGETALLRALDGVFEGWAAEAGAASLIMPPLLPIASLAKLDYFENFPQQAVVASTLDLTRHEPGAKPERFTADRLEPAELALPSAACFAVYLHYEGVTVADGTTATVLGRCFRREERYDGLRRLLGFHMREIVALGSRDFTHEHLARFAARISSFADALGLPLRKEAATDPFYESGGERALLQRLSPVKHEYLAGELAIASLNVHRNFFGERCGITLVNTGEPVFTSCVAFGLERWLSVLHDRFGGWDAATGAVRDAAARVAVQP